MNNGEERRRDNLFKIEINFSHISFNVKIMMSLIRRKTINSLRIKYYARDIYFNGRGRNYFRTGKVYVIRTEPNLTNECIICDIRITWVRM